MSRILILLVCMVLFFSTNICSAWEPDEVLSDHALEMRARKISAQLRCLVCQNESIDGSDAALAKDLRILVRDRLAAGATDEEVFTFLVHRYGEFILLKPQLNDKTLLLWSLPLFLLLLGSFAIAIMFRKRSFLAPVEDLSSGEKRHIAELMDSE